MLREIEVSPYRRHSELSRSFRSDVVIVGGGVMGLLTAKKLTDLGQTVTLLEESSTIAHGASIKNHGWLHRGTAHAISIKDNEQAKYVVQKLIYGYEYLKSYAQECVEEPFSPVFSVTQDEKLASHAVATWDNLGVNYEKISREDFVKIDPFVNPNLPFHIFKSADLQINNRMLFQKLLTDINNKNGVVINEASYLYSDDNEIEVSSKGEIFTVSADTFIYCTGANLKETYRKLTGRSIGVSFWKSHLVFLPRINPHSLVSLDRDQPIIINHGETSIVNRAYDEVECEEPDYSINLQQVELAFDSLCNMYPCARNLKSELQYIACVKPSVHIEDASRHSVDSQIFEPIPNHFFVLPGKMTEAPYVADELLHRLYQKLDFAEITPRPIDCFEKQRTTNSELLIHKHL